MGVPVAAKEVGEEDDDDDDDDEGTTEMVVVLLVAVHVAWVHNNNNNNNNVNKVKVAGNSNMVVGKVGESVWMCVRFWAHKYRKEPSSESSSSLVPRLRIARGPKARRPVEKNTNYFKKFK